MLTAAPVHAVLYLLTPPPAPTGPDQDGWDTALADGSGRARPLLCGLAALPSSACGGNPATFGA